MKSIEIKLSIVLALLIISAIYSAKVKKTENNVEFFNDLLLGNTKSEKERANSEMKNLKMKNMKNLKNKYKLKSAVEDDPPAEPAAEPAPEAPKEDMDGNPSGQNVTNVYTPTLDADGLYYKGWLKISSPLFRLNSLFPPIRILDENGKEKTVEVKVNKDDYRVNENQKIVKKEELDKRDFFFKLKDNFLFYSIDESDINVLQTFHVDQIDKVDDWKFDVADEFGKEIFYFTFYEKMTKFSYKIASFNKEELIKFYCILTNLIKKPKDFCLGVPLPVIRTIIKEEIEDKIILVPVPSKVCNDKWNYDNKGEDWECLCKEGQMQSPIDLPDKTLSIPSPVTPLFKFDQVESKSKLTTLDGLIRSNTYNKIRFMDGALRILHHDMGKIVTLNGATYIAEEINFHTPSEHTIAGKRFDMEMQVVFYGVSKGDIAKQVILSFLFEKKAGYYNRFLDDVDFYTLPNRGMVEREILNNLFIPKVLYSTTGEEEFDEMPTLKPFSFYTYEGSLTMPPCSEDTIHYVAAEPIPIGSIVLQLANEALRMPNIEATDNETGEKRILQDQQDTENYRNIQARNDRAVFYFDHLKYCGDTAQIVRERKISGHYEKIRRKISDYIYVPGEQPSHIPGAFVVSEKEAKNDQDIKIVDMTESS